MSPRSVGLEREPAYARRSRLTVRAGARGAIAEANTAAAWLQASGATVLLPPEDPEKLAAAMLLLQERTTFERSSGAQA
jgi:hypothetical protein